MVVLLVYMSCEGSACWEKQFMMEMGQALQRVYKS